MAKTKEEAAESLRAAAKELRRIAADRAANLPAGRPQRVKMIPGPAPARGAKAPTQADRMEQLAEALHPTE